MKFNKKAFLPFIILIASCSSESDSINEMEETISPYIINSILELSECLSIKATPGEKYGIVQATTIDTNIRDSESINKYLKQSREDFKFLLEVSEKKCPSSLRIAVNAIHDAKSKNGRIQAEELLQQIIVSSLSGEILTIEEKKRIFENNYKPI